MGTKFRTMLAPIGLSTGDGRRFADGSMELATTPFPFEWAREREGGHDGAVVIGAVQEAAILSVADALAQDYVSPANAKGLDRKMMAVWARGELFDAVSREDMPRLAEDVAESMHLIDAGTLGPSVDLDSFEGVPVIAGTDEEVTWERLEEIYEETGEEPRLELLITQGRVRAATLVSIPAFAETPRPLELVAANPAEDTDADKAAAETERVAALIASVGAAALPEVAAFALPALTGPTPITWDFETGRVFGHVATWRTCHVGYADVCVTAPRDETGEYAWFNRHPVQTDDGGTIWAGRITVGGRHPGLSLTAGATMTQYDAKTVAAHVRAYSDEHGIVVAGVISPGLDASARSVLARRKVSGDWRETPAGLSLVEVLALSPGPRAHAEPGFPIPGTFSRGGRQVALTAALGPDPDSVAVLRSSPPLVDVDALAEALERRQADRAAVQAARAELVAVAEPVLAAEREAARAALAARLFDVPVEMVMDVADA
jgi:hypothetical protein